MGERESEILTPGPQQTSGLTCLPLPFLAGGPLLLPRLFLLLLTPLFAPTPPSPSGLMMVKAPTVALPGASTTHGSPFNPAHTSTKRIFLSSWNSDIYRTNTNVIQMSKNEMNPG